MTCDGFAGLVDVIHSRSEIFFPPMTSGQRWPSEAVVLASAERR
jgi:hypothetical protein